MEVENYEGIVKRSLRGLVRLVNFFLRVWVDIACLFGILLSFLVWFAVTVLFFWLIGGGLDTVFRFAVPLSLELFQTSFENLKQLIIAAYLLLIIPILSVGLLILNFLLSWKLKLKKILLGFFGVGALALALLVAEYWIEENKSLNVTYYLLYTELSQNNDAFNAIGYNALGNSNNVIEGFIFNLDLPAQTPVEKAPVPEKVEK